MFPGMEHLGCMWLATGGSQNGGRPGDDVSTMTPHDHAYPQPGHTTTGPLRMACVPLQIFRYSPWAFAASWLSQTRAILILF